MFNKPRGCVTARSDSSFRTVLDYFPPELAEKLHPVGRLDKDSCGLLILTDDGDLDCKILLPGKRVPKTYFFVALGVMTDEKIRRLEEGMRAPGLDAGRAELRTLKEYRIREIADLAPPERRGRYMKNPEGAAFSAEIVIREGKKREIRRILEALHCRVIYLRRDRIGGLSLDGSLAPGEYRELAPEEVEALKLGGR